MAISIFFDIEKKVPYPDSMGITSIHFDQLKQVTFILFKVGKYEEIPAETDNITDTKVTQ